MKRSMGLFLGLWCLIGFVSSSVAINIKEAEIEHGAVAVMGNQAARRAPITWEGVQVTTSNNGGVFKFTTSILPVDCVGKLSDGMSTIEVVIENCMPALNRFLAPVPQTGQVKCYDETGTTILCSGTGQDGELQKGVKLPIPRFTDNGNGTFTDNLTGLMWLRNANCNAGALTTWQDALDAVASLNATGTMLDNDCGDTSNNGTHQTDWRLPNIRELLSLLDYRFSQPPLSNAAGTEQAQCFPIVDCPFSQAGAPRLWSSTTVAFTPGQAWTVDLTSDLAIQLPIQKSAIRSILAVRGGS